MKKYVITFFSFSLMLFALVTFAAPQDIHCSCTVNQKEFAEFISQEKLDARVQDLGRAIRIDYADRSPIFIGVLNGSFMFFADLVRAAGVDCEIDFIQISSYGDHTKSSGTVRMSKDVSRSIAVRDIIIVEDIIDSGLSMDFIIKHITALNPASIKIATLLYKKDAIKIHVPVDYIGFEIASDFVVGYGLDYAQKGRHLGAIYKAL
ncbi:MAG: hypoxanthine phosphoribosyltransferase [Candidatus Dependentiae bacterium]|nr:hypoxanthine phosphoribosyltransferase [Candidatus Dependentiae bacterium]